MPTVIKKFVTPKHLDMKLGELLVGQQYGELLFISDDQPVLSDEEAMQRSIAMQEYKKGETMSFDELKNQL